MKFHGRYDRRVIAETQFAKIFAVKMKRDCFANIGHCLIKRFAFSNHGQVHAVGDVFGFAAENAHLDGSSLHDTSLTLPFARSTGD